MYHPVRELLRARDHSFVRTQLHPHFLRIARDILQAWQWIVDLDEQHESL